MKVLVIGGYGVFGGRLARLLLADGHEVLIAGRSLAAAQAFVATHGGTALQVDRDGDLSALAGADVVVDASGPFDSTRPDPYRVARAAIAARIPYLDLSDNAAFCAGITVLDEAAKQAGVSVLSGVSSVPALSSAATQALAEGANIDSIDAAILPGNKAPRGRSVVESILSHCGQPFTVTTDGTPESVRSWSDPQRYDLGRGHRRQGWVIEVPDQRLLPVFFKARTVSFRAGLELGVMRFGLGIWSWLLSRFGWRSPSWMIAPVMRVAQWLTPFGSDLGGMVVQVIFRKDGGWQRGTWRLRVADGDGPFIPAVPARAILRDLAAIPSGARPALAEVPLAAMESAMEGLATMTERESAPLTPVFPRFLGPAFDSLPPQIRALHDVPAPRVWAGRASVRRGRGPVARLIQILFRFPAESEDVALRVSMVPTKGGELWTRRFGARAFRSFLSPRNGRMTERFGPFNFDLGLEVRGDQLHYPVTGGRFLGVPLPRFSLPRSIAHEEQRDGRFHFDVELRAPITGARIVHYQGWLERAVPLNADGAVLNAQTD